MNLDQRAPSGAPDITPGKGQATLTFVEDLGTTGIGAKVERDPPFSGFKVLRTIRHPAEYLLNLAGFHADLESGELRAPGDDARHLAIERSVTRLH